MTYGIKMWDDAGQVTYSSEDVTWNLIASVVAPVNLSQSWTIDVSNYQETTIVLQMIEEVRPDQESFVHSVTLSGSTLTASAPSSIYTQRTMITVLGR
jgi:hypothetical protein